MNFEGFPLVIGWELTFACNLKCAHCGSAAGAPKPNELSLDEALSICDQLPYLLAFEVDFTGGEPLCRPDWWKIAERLHMLGIRTRLITNGVLLNEATAARIKQAGVDRIGVSVDGLQATHDQIRGRPGLFRHIQKGIGQVVNAGVPVSAITTVNALNINELDAIYDVLVNAGVDIWQVQPVFPLGRAREFPQLQLSTQDYLRLGDFAHKHRAYTRDANGLTLVPGDSFGYYTQSDPRQPDWDGCPAGIVMCGITCDGKIKGCLSMPDAFIEGDLRTRDLWDIWFDPNAFKYNRQFGTEQLGPNCQNCTMAALCRGGCTSMSYAYTGIPHNDPMCFHGIRNRQVLHSTTPAVNEHDLQTLPAWQVALDA